MEEVTSDKTGLTISVPTPCSSKKKQTTTKNPHAHSLFRENVNTQRFVLKLKGRIQTFPCGIQHLTIQINLSFTAVH